jgi:hypothetical protein
MSELINKARDLMPDPPTPEEIEKLKEEEEARRRRDYFNRTKTPKSVVVPLYTEDIK